MRRIITLVVAALTLLTVVPQQSYAASRGHARAGLTAGFTSSSSNSKRWDANSIGRYHFGFTAQLPIALGFAIQPSVLYQAKGTKLNGAEAETSDINAKVSYLEIPVQVQWGPDLVAFRPYVFVEPFVGYGLHAKAKSTEDGTSVKTTSFEKAGLARWEYGASLGAGIDVWKLQASVKYYWNFGSLYNESGKMNDVGSQIKDAFKDGRNFNGVTISIAYFF
ncbi:MAG: porin family protein [Candidatus Cryptobacteroides sp.]